MTCETTTLVTTCPTSGSGLKHNHPNGFTKAGDWERLLRPIPGSTGLTHVFNPSGYGSSHQVTVVDQNDGSPVYGTTLYQYDARGNRIQDDNSHGTLLQHDRRDFTYDARGNVINVRGSYYAAGAWHTYVPKTRHRDHRKRGIVIAENAAS